MSRHVLCLTVAIHVQALNQVWNVAAQGAQSEMDDIRNRK